MFKLTSISRKSDNLALAAPMEDDEKELEEYKTQKKKILVQLSMQPNPPKHLTIASGPYNFHILTDTGVIYMTLCEKEYSSQMAYSFLEDLRKEFVQLYGNEVQNAERPYAFIKFDNFIQKTRRLFADTRTKKNIQKLKEELNDVQQIIRKNIEDVIGRGEKLNEMNTMSSNLLTGAKSLRTGAKQLNDSYFWKTYGPIVVILIIVVLVVILRFWLW